MHGASELGVVLFTKPFHQLQATTPNCVFYYYLVLSLFIQLMLYSHMCYSCQALQAEKERETHKHPCNIVEEHYALKVFLNYCMDVECKSVQSRVYFDQEEEYMRDSQDKINCQDVM